MKINRLKLMLQMLIIKILQVLFVILRLMLTLTTKGTYFQMLKLMLEPIVMKMQLITNFVDNFCASSHPFYKSDVHVLDRASRGMHPLQKEKEETTCKFSSSESKTNLNSSFDEIVKDSCHAMNDGFEPGPHPLHNIAFKGMSENPQRGFGANFSLQDNNSSCLGLYSQYGSDHNILATRTGTEILGATGNSELCRKFSGDPLLFESWHIRVCQEIINKNVIPNSALEYILSQTSGKPNEVVISMAGIEFQTSWSLKHI